ncbi:MAG TPA: type VI secretion system tube protein Hcp, partial [Planctomycetota bacterium]|nr:type VI secretion system tube protein Hcp [Planctomycetota bacterium]
RATPLLARAAAQGRRFPEALVEICDGGDVVQLRLRLTDVLIRSWALSSVRESPEPAPYENCSLTAAAVEWIWLPASALPVRASYQPQAEPVR